MVPSKGGLRVGFHERRSSYIVDMRTCPVLPPAISALLPRLRTLLAGLSIADRLPQVEIAVGDGPRCSCSATCCPSAADDLKRLAAFADAEGIQVWIQPERARIRRGRCTRRTRRRRPTPCPSSTCAWIFARPTSPR
jgi:23S rRNA (uracil1939-C5)-methyltransferase